MSGSPYDVVSAPSYGAPVLDWANFFPHKQQQQQGQGQQGQPQRQGFLSKLSDFLHGPQSPVQSAPQTTTAGSDTPQGSGARPAPVYYTPPPQVGQPGSPSPWPTQGSPGGAAPLNPLYLQGMGYF